MKRSLKKLISDTCQKTAFSFNGEMYEQTDGVSMGGSLGPVSANIIVTECEKVIVNQLIEYNIVKFYIRYVDDTLLVHQNTDKNTQSDQYINIESFTLWKWKILWITSLTIRAKRICPRNHLNQEINLIKDYAAWNGFLKRVANSVIKRSLQTNNSNTTRSKKDNADSTKTFLNLNYSGETAERMVKK